MKKKFIVILSLMTFVFLGMHSFADDTWKVPVKFMNAYEAGKESMANQALKPEAEVVVSAHSSKITLYLKPIQFGKVSDGVNKVFLLEDNRRVEATKTDSGEMPYNTKIEFETGVAKPKEVKLSVWVNAMDALKGGKEGAGEQTVILALDWDKATAGKMESEMMPLPKSGIYVTVGGKEVKFDAKPVNKDGRILVPLRAIFEALDVEVKWDGTSRTVTASKEGKVLTLGVDKTEAQVSDGANKNTIKLDVPAKIQEGRVYVPIRFIGEAFGNKVDYKKEGDLSIVSIEKNN